MMTRHFFAIATCATLLTGCGVGSYKKPRAEEKPPVTRLTLLPQSPVAQGKASTVWLKVNHAEERRLLTAQDLKKVRDYPIHLMIIDSSFTDYQHIHPTPTDLRGVFSFSFTPKSANRYRVWADVAPLPEGKQEFTFADLGTSGDVLKDKATRDQASVGGYHFTLNWNQPPSQYETSTGTVTVTDRSGHAVGSAFLAHVDGFHEDFRTVLHANARSESGEGKLQFDMDPTKQGFLKLYALVIIDGKQFNVPFAVNVIKRP